VYLPGTRLVKAAFCQPAETYERAAIERWRRTATFVYSSLLHHRRCFCDIWYGQIIALSLFTLRRHVARSANSGHGPCTRHDRVRGHCNGTQYVIQQVSHGYIKAEIVCCSSHRYRCRLCLYSRIAVHGGIAMRKSAKRSLFVTNFGISSESVQCAHVCHVSQAFCN